MAAQRAIRVTSGVVAMALLACACGDEENDTAAGGAAGQAGASACGPGSIELPDGACVPAGTQPDGCAAGEVGLAGGACRPAGTQPEGCAAGELATDGACQPAGVPAEQCAAGFEPDEAGGCTALLPSEPCPDGTMAALGELACHELAPCGDTPWGTIPVESSTQFVDESFVGSSDGSAAAPWTSIQAAITAAEPHAIVAIAAGTYAEDLELTDKTVKLWGRCPAMAAVVGSASGTAAIRVGPGSDGSELRDLAVTGGAIGVLVQGATDVVIDRVWIHDTGGYGLSATDGPPATGISVHGSLIEATYEQGVWVSGSGALIEATAVRDTLPRSTGHGWGISVLEDETTYRRANATIRSCVVENNPEIGIIVHQADATIESTLVRDTVAGPTDRFGRAIVVQSQPGASQVADATLRGVVVERCRDTGVFVAGSHAAIESTVVRDVRPRLDTGEHGVGISAQGDPITLAGPSTLTVRQVLVERVTEMGVFVAASEATLEGLLVRGVAPLADGTFGRGVAFQSHPSADMDTTGTLRGSLIEQTWDAGLFVSGADLTVEGVLIRDTQSAADSGEWGIGLVAQPLPERDRRSQLQVRWSAFEDNHFAGVLVGGSDATIEGCAVRRTLPRERGGMGGRGMLVQDSIDGQQRGVATIQSSLVEDCVETGIFVAGADAFVDGVRVSRTADAPVGALVSRGINVQVDLATGVTSTAQVRHSLVEGSRETGIFVAASEASIEATLVRDTLPGSLNLFGDGLGFLGLAPGDTTVDVAGSEVRTSARVAVGAFGATVNLGSSRLECNPIALDAERPNAVPFALTDLGGNACGCGLDTQICQVLTANLAVPEPVTD